MKMTVKPYDLDTGGKTVAVLNLQDALELGVYSLDRVVIEAESGSVTAVINTSERFVRPGEIGIFDEIKEKLGVRTGQQVEVSARRPLKSKEYIRRKIEGIELTGEEIREIIRDVVERNLNDLELTAFIMALHLKGLSMGESTSLIEAMVETGDIMTFGDVVCDKHSVGGVPGDKTSLLVVPVIASLGLLIPKTSSRAITSPAGTADRAEMLMPVELGLEEIEEVTRKTNGCLVWGGALDLAPADDLLIQIEHPLGVDPLLLASILSKKKSVGATHVVIDIPTGSDAKIKTPEKAHRLADQFVNIGKKLDLNIQCGITLGEQPIGHCIGPALEAREALKAISSSESSDLKEKVTSLCGILLSLVGKAHSREEGRLMAQKALEQKKADAKLREIIAAQGGDPDVDPDDIAVGSHVTRIYAESPGIVRWIDNPSLVRIATAAGCPRDTGAGVRLYKKMGTMVQEGDVLMEIFAEKSHKLQQAERIARESAMMGVIDRWENHMLLQFVG
ncbi:MAG: AMP phosphorylase [Theionarchaea archaeon]|nr:AMP phosphorylase [Theionarchaea archaeon]MBU7037290.1 AMP phosphorylase [Theionarchaea archaeon]